MSSQFGDFMNEIYLAVVQRNLKCITVLLLAVTISLVVALVVMSHNSNEIAEEMVEEEQRVCLTSGCIRRASIVLNNMDSSINPCDDFYNFACGGFLSKTYIPEDQSAVTSITTIKNLVYHQIRTMLEESAPLDEIQPFVLAGKFYSSCVNMNAIEADGLTTIKEILDSLGGWPLLEGTNWYDAKFDWRQAMYTLRNIGFKANYFLSVEVVTDLKNSSRRVISIDQASLELPREILLQGLNYSMAQLYYKYMVDVAVIFGANRSIAEDEMQDCLDLQMEIAKISLSTGERQNETLLYNPMTIAELDKFSPIANWKQYIKNLLDIPDFQISEDETVIVCVPRYLHDLEDLLDRTTERSQANYVMWRVVSAAMKYLTEELQDREVEFVEGLRGASLPLPRWRECIHQTLDRFWKPIRTLYDRKHFAQKSKIIASEISSNIHAEFSDILVHTEWMDEETKEKALEKAAALKTYSATFEVESDEAMIEYYSKLEFQTDNYLRMVLSVSLFDDNRNFMNLRKPVDSKEKRKDISMEYNIYVPGGIFQEVLFDNELPHYMNYGGIGTLMGHLLTHEFDDGGRQLDKDGDLANWWTESTEAAFYEQAQCFTEHYENYTSSELLVKTNGNSTRDENLADSGGMKAAYLAYNAWVASNDSEPQLPGLNYTAQQMFWISAANVYCSKYRKELFNLQIMISRTASDDYRVKGPLSNSEYFGEDFNCPLGSNMNPVEKCKVW